MVLAALALAPVACGSGATKLQGRTADVTLDTSGFTKEQGPQSLGGAYERLAQYAQPGAKGLRFSVLVDSPPGGFDASKLKAQVLNGYKARYAGQTPTVTDSQTPPGFTVEWTETLAAGPKQWNHYFETLQGGRWLEVHFSALDPAPGDIAALRAKAQHVLARLQFTPK